MSLTILHTAGRQGLAAIPSLALVVALPAFLLDRGVEQKRTLRIVDVAAVLDGETAAFRYDPQKSGVVVGSRGSEVLPFCLDPDVADDGEMTESVRTYRLCGAAAEVASRRCDAPTVAPTPVPLPAKVALQEQTLTYVVDGDLHVEGIRTLAFELTGLVGRDVNIVVRGDVFIADDLYVDEGKLRIYAVEDARTGRGGNIVLGDARFGTLAHVEADLVATGRIRRLPGADAATVGRVAVEGVPLTLR